MCHTYFSNMTPRSLTMWHARSLTMWHKILTVTSSLEPQAPLFGISRNVTERVCVMNIVRISNLYTCYGRIIVNRWWLPFHTLSLWQCFWTMRDDSLTFPRIGLSERFGMRCHATEAKCHSFWNRVTLLRKKLQICNFLFSSTIVSLSKACIVSLRPFF